MRVPQKEGAKGSLKWMQALTSHMPHSVGSRLKSLVGLKETDHIDWLSPAPGDRAEFRDREFLEQIGQVALAGKLADFWPGRGPQWDGLARCGQKVILVEAKAHPAEMKSTCAAGPESLPKIRASLEKAKQHFGGKASSDWTQGYYQYANRLAHLHFLRSNGVDAHLVLIYFVNDREMGGPSSAAGWAPAIAEAHEALGLPQSSDRAGIHELFVDVKELGG